MSNSDTRTEVSKSDPGIKKILAATVEAGGRKWSGRRVVVIATRAPDWSHTDYLDDQPHGWYLHLKSMSAVPTQRPTYGSARWSTRPSNDHALVIHQRFMGKDTGVEIIIPESRLDPSAISVAVDAIIQGGAAGKKTAKKALADLGDTAGVAMAVAEARAKTLNKAEAVRGGAEQTPRSKRQLEREIGAILGRDIFGHGLT